MASKFTLVWKGDRVVRNTRRKTRAAMKRVAAEVERDIKRWIRHKYPPASRPGQRPRIRTGNLKRSIKVTAHGQSLRVETIGYGPFLERGTRKMAKRPFIAPILRGRANKRKWTAKISKYARQAK